jgi:hypothetical protein
MDVFLIASITSPLSERVKGVQRPSAGCLSGPTADWRVISRPRGAAGEGCHDPAIHGRAQARGRGLRAGFECLRQCRVTRGRGGVATSRIAVGGPLLRTWRSGDLSIARLDGAPGGR